MAVLVDHLHRFRTEDYLRLVGDEDAARWERTELVEGVVYDVSPESSLHAKTAIHVFDALRAVLKDRTVRNLGSVEIGPDSLWDPDVYVLRPGAPDRTYPLAEDVELVVEVSLSTLTADLGPKYRGYATAGIPQYWVIAPEAGGYLLRHRHPAGGRYELVERFELPGGCADLDVAALVS